MSSVVAYVGYVVLLFFFVFKDLCNSAVDYIDHDYGQPGSEKDCSTKGFLEKGVNSLKIPGHTVPCPSKSIDLRKNNIFPKDDIQFIHIFRTK